ncbi:MAG: M4 family metallopeptidase [Desulfobacteraceae bacterium]|jgi:thermolysin
MKNWKGMLAIAILTAALVLMAPLKAMALTAAAPAGIEDAAALLSMGNKPTPSATPVTTATPRRLINHGLQKIAIHEVSQTLGAKDPAANAVSTVGKLLKGETLTKELSLHAKSSDTSRLQGFGARLKRAIVDRSGNRHVRTVQTYQGVPVAGAEVVVHINDQNQVYRIAGTYLPDLALSVEPSISGSDALEAGLRDFQNNPDVVIDQDPELVIFGKRLAYHYILSHLTPDPGRWIYYVDAHGGQILWRYNDMQSATPGDSGSYQNLSGQRLAGEDGSQVVIPGWYDADTNFYFLFNASNNWGIYDEDAADWEQQHTADWSTNDPAAVSAAYNLELTQSYVTSVLGRNGFDDQNALAKATVHFDTDLVNAYWTGSEILLGDGDGTTANELAVLDVVAHEYGHALTDYTSNLIYQDESGALNEAYSDIFGTVVEFWAQPDGTVDYPLSSPGTSDWLIGEDSWLSQEALRNLRDPISYNFPAYYQGTHWYFGESDNGGVHTNANVLCHAFYLLAEGGSGSIDGSPYNLSGIGITDAGQIALRANLYYHLSTDGYPEARQAWMDAADDLGLSSDAVEAVFDAVGVPGDPPDDFDLFQPVSTTNPDGYPNQDFTAADYDQYDIFIADDFSFESTVDLTGIYVPNYMWNPGRPIFNAERLHFEIYADDNGRPDGDPSGSGNAPIWSESIDPGDAQIKIYKGASDLMSNILLAMETPVTLPAGTYWLVAYPELTYASYGQSARHVSDTKNGATAMVINPGKGFGLPDTWTPVTDISIWDNDMRDLAFGINATPYHTAKFNAGTGGQIVGSTTQEVLDGQDSTAVEAVADSGYIFDGWSGGYTGMDNPLTLSRITQNMTVTANFVSVSSSSTGGDSSGSGGSGAGCFLSSIMVQ